MRRSRHILAVMAVAGALCADRMVSAAPLARPPVAEMAARLVTRLSRTFQQALPSELRPAMRRQPLAIRPRIAPMPARRPAGLHRELSPFQFRLPPPAI